MPFATFSTFRAARIRWEKHNCTSASGVCDCGFDFHCIRCDNIVRIHGEDMPHSEGLCASCAAGGNMWGELPDDGDDDGAYFCEWCQVDHYGPCEVPREAQAQINELRALAYREEVDVIGALMAETEREASL